MNGKRVAPCAEQITFLLLSLVVLGLPVLVFPLWKRRATKQSNSSLQSNENWLNEGKNWFGWIKEMNDCSPLLFHCCGLWGQRPPLTRQHSFPWISFIPIQLACLLSCWWERRRNKLNERWRELSEWCEWSGAQTYNPPLRNMKNFVFQWSRQSTIHFIHQLPFTKEAK